MEILNFDDFIFESVNTQKRIYFFASGDFIEVLESISNNEIAEEIVNLTYNHVKTDITNIKIVGDSIEFTRSEHLYDELERNGKDPKDYLEVRRLIFKDSNISNFRRSVTRVGRMVKMLFGDDFTDKQIETFSNKFKALLTNDVNFDIIELPSIAYDTRNYVKSFYSSPLHSSCMNDEEDIVAFYDLITNKVSVLVLKDNNDLIVARALIWNLDCGRKLMDRVYYTLEKYYYKFVEYAKNNNLIYKSENTFGKKPFIINGEQKDDILTVTLDDWEIIEEKVPYMDTMIYCYGNVLSSSPEKFSDKIYYYVLNGVDGYDHDKIYN